MASDRMLSRSLKELVADGLVRRDVQDTVTIQVTYDLTPDARALMPILEEFDRWGKERIDNMTRSP